MVQLKRFVTAEQKSKKVFPPGMPILHGLVNGAQWASGKRISVVYTVSITERSGGYHR